MDVFVVQSPEETAELIEKVKQPVLDNKFKKKAMKDVNQYVGKWFYEFDCLFNTPSLLSFKQMVHAIGKFGAFNDLLLPYELRGTILQK